MAEEQERQYADLQARLCADGTPATRDATDLITHLGLMIRLHQASLSSQPSETIIAAMRAVASSPLGNLASSDLCRRREEIKKAIARDQSDLAMEAAAAILQLESTATTLHLQLSTQINRRLQDLRDNPASWGAG